MEKHVGLNPAWFEPGPDGESPFVRKYNASPGTAGEAISAAFRALLAEDAVQEVTPPALGDLGKVVQVPEMVSPKVAEFIQAKDAEIARLTEEVEQLREELSRVINISADRVAERDALRARIDAGVRAWEKWKQQCGSLWLWAFPGATASQAWSDVCDALDADYVVYPIEQPVDERKGEEVVNSTGIQYRGHWLPFHDRRRTAGTIADRGKA